MSCIKGNTLTCQADLNAAQRQNRSFSFSLWLEKVKIQYVSLQNEFWEYFKCRRINTGRCNLCTVEYDHLQQHCTKLSESFLCNIRLIYGTKHEQ